MFLVIAIFAILVSVSSVNAIPVGTSSQVYVSTHGSDTNNGSAEAPYLTIQKGVESAAENGTVHIANGIYSGEGNTNITIGYSMNLIGQSQVGTIINGSNTNWMFNIQSGTVTIQNLTFVNANDGAIYNSEDATTTINDCTFKGNTGDDGGAIMNDGTLTVNRSTFTGNSAYEGGAIYQCDGTARIIDSTFTGNTAYYEGGAIYMDSQTTTTITGCTFTGNTAALGGAIANPYGYDVTFNMTNSTLKNNKAVEQQNNEELTGGLGGGLYLSPRRNYSYNIIGNHFLNNVGSGIYIQNFQTPMYSLSKDSAPFTNELLINFNRFFGNTPYGVYYNNTTSMMPKLLSAAPVSSSPVLDAKYNWWGSNSGPNAVGADKTNLESTYYAPWIVMRLSPTNVLMNGGTTTKLTANFFYDSNGTYHDPANGHIPDGTPVTFTTSLGQVGSQTITKYTVNGIATAVLRAWNAAGDPVSGMAFITATLDAQTLSGSVNIQAVPTANAASSNTVAMQKTGSPLNYLILAILAVIGGFVMPRRK
jgi:predicted outer membrane repeat protein